MLFSKPKVEVFMSKDNAAKHIEGKAEIITKSLTLKHKGKTEGSGDIKKRTQEYFTLAKPAIIKLVNKKAPKCAQIGVITSTSGEIDTKEHFAGLSISGVDPKIISFKLTLTLDVAYY